MEDGFKRPPAPASKARKTSKRKIDGAADQESAVEPQIANEDDDQWLFFTGEKNFLPIEADESDFGSSSDQLENVNNIRLYQRNNIHHWALWRTTAENKGHPWNEYPKRGTAPCIKCGDTDYQNWVPIFPPVDFDEQKTRTWVLTPFTHCSASCAKGSIIEGPSGLKGKELGLLGRFIREYFDPKLMCINYIPVSMIKEINPLSGCMTREQYRQNCHRFDGTLQLPPFMFVDTSVELISTAQKEEERRQRFDQLAASKVSEEQQSKFKLNMERVIQQKNQNSVSIENSMLGRKLNMYISKKS